MVRQPRSLSQMVNVGGWAVQERDCPSGDDVHQASRCLEVIRDQFSGLVALSAPNRDQPSARATATGTKWGRITPKTHQNRGDARQNPPKQGQNPPNQGQSLPKPGYLQIGTTPATHPVRCDADATHKAWTNMSPGRQWRTRPPGVHHRDRIFSNDPVCRTHPRRWRWGTDPGWQPSHAPGPQTSQTFIPR